ncbi:TolC family protein [Thermosulfuriphilus ammonigenes]|uniref:TolC family protein n=1 Tax=Thermosulfuriphilus ammonigenes TaxID=1936021 RepID=A0A6G7PUM1_9BACT|nr:TolC family protein [Thermosulfuriphilus ammonigenes]MBA2848465.1 outer membrane protein TolC [Thermosulfuriphilus ammonigenes]QIJ71384.1 TolC family protein [Thermosulfuriphilus ammonigenes]
MKCPNLLKILFILALSIIWASPGLADSPLTLDKALREALKRNPEILARKYEVAASKERYRAERGKLFPQVNFIAQASRLSDAQAVVPIKGPGPFPAFSRDRYFFNLETLLPIYEGGRLRRRAKIAELAIAFKEGLSRQTALDLLANVKDTFYLALYLEALVSAREKTLAALKDQEKEAELRLKVGRIPPLDLMRIRTQVRAEEAALSAAKEALRRAKEALSVLLGEPPRSDFRVAGTLEIKKLKLQKIDIEEALSCRPDIFAQRQAVRQAQEEIKLASGEHLPSLDLFADYGRRAGSGLNDSEEVWEAGVRLRLNIFSGGTISARVAEARSRALAERERLRLLELSARREIADALSLIAQAEEEVAHFEAARATAKEAFRVESLKYRTGAGTVTDMLLAQAAWAQAEADYLGARYRLAKAYVAYERATTLIARGWLKLECWSTAKFEGKNSKAEK